LFAGLSEILRDIVVICGLFTKPPEAFNEGGEDGQDFWRGGGFGVGDGVQGRGFEDALSRFVEAVVPFTANP
jgi:hypothetical protein